MQKIQAAFKEEKAECRTFPLNEFDPFQFWSMPMTIGKQTLVMKCGSGVFQHLLQDSISGRVGTHNSLAKYKKKVYSVNMSAKCSEQLKNGTRQKTKPLLPHCHV